MGNSSPRDKQGSRSRFHVIEPAPRDRRSEGALLEELERVLGEDPAGAELWRGLRCARAWIGRGSPAGGAEDGPPDVTAALGLLTHLRRSPASTGPVTAACRQIFQWAESQGLPETALQYAELAAEIDPENPAWPNRAAMLARRAGDWPRSEVWYSRAIGLAKRNGDPTEYIAAQIGLGHLYYVRRQFKPAWRHLRRGANRAFRWGRREKAASAHHNMMLLAAETEVYRLGERHARKALALFPVRHHRIPYFVHDYGHLLLMSGLFTPALHLLDFTLPYFTSPAERLLVSSSVAWAAAGLRNRSRYDTASQEVLAHASRYTEHAPAALRVLADGARAFGDWSRAAQLATLASQTGPSPPDLWDQAANHTLWTRIDSHQPLPREATAPPHTDVPGLVETLKERLERWHQLQETFRARHF